jgi:hypothetical protein
MLKINLTADKQARLLAEHERSLLPLVRQRLNEAANVFLRDHLANDAAISAVLTGVAADLEGLHAALLTDLKRTYTETAIMDALKRVFDPARFFDKKRPRYNAYHLCRSLQQRTCPYCNVLPTITHFKQDPVYRPPLDHFFPFSLAPGLGLSFFNLIPACTKCNSTFKLAKPTSSTTHLHPYLGGFGDNCVFAVTGFKRLDDIIGKRAGRFEIVLQNPGGDVRYDGNKQLFELETVYSAHKRDAVNSLIIADRYSREMIESIIKLTRTTRTGSYEQLFKTLYEIPGHHFHPLSKLNRDLVRQHSSAHLKALLGLT